ncbi:MAG: hypothetical protein H6556_29680 [Lewinellaceae bacterium]|nr:hypothetical protein [Lewinellaceae bacterium]
MSRLVHIEVQPPGKSFTGAGVYDCGFPADGEYVLVEEGIGSSFPSRITCDALRGAYYTYVRYCISGAAASGLLAKKAVMNVESWNAGAYVIKIEDIGVGSIFSIRKGIGCNPEGLPDSGGSLAEMGKV